MTTVETKETKEHKTMRLGKGRPRANKNNCLPTALAFLTQRFKENPYDPDFGKNAMAIISELYRAPALALDSKNITDQYVKLVKWGDKEHMIEPVLTKGKMGLNSVAAMASKLKTECIKLNVKDPEYVLEIERLKFTLPAWKAEFEEYDSHPLSIMERLRLKYKYFPTPGAQAKKIISKLQPLPKGIRELRLSRDDMEELKKYRKSRLDKKLKEVPVPINANQLLTAAQKWLSGTNVDELVPALLLFTGRRTVEVLLTGSFQETPSKDPMRAVFSGQVKQGLQGTQPYEIPLLAPLNEIQPALKLVRAKLATPGQHDTAITHRKFSMVVRRMVTAALKPVLGFSLPPHALRAVYANICSSIHNNPQKMAYTAYLGTLLGHDSLISALHYQSIQVTNLPVPVAAPTS